MAETSSPRGSPLDIQRRVVSVYVVAGAGCFGILFLVLHLVLGLSNTARAVLTDLVAKDVEARARILSRDICDAGVCKLLEGRAAPDKAAALRSVAGATLRGLRASDASIVGLRIVDRKGARLASDGRDPAAAQDADLLSAALSGRVGSRLLKLAVHGGGQDGGTPPHRIATIAAPLIHDHGGGPRIMGAVTVAADVEPYIARIDRIRNRSLSVGIAVVLASFALVAWLLYRFHRAVYRRSVALSAALDETRRAYDDLAQTRTRLARSERLSTIGEIMAGVAHELNNPLSVVLGYANMLLDEPGLPAAARDDVGAVREGAERCAEVVRNLLAFAREEKLEKKACNAMEVLHRALKLVAHEFSTAGIALEDEGFSDGGMLQVWANAGQLQQVAVNLLNNARQAMESAGKGSRVLYRLERGEDELTLHVEDDGPGMSREVLEHIFEPFFTTKEVGRGTGLGLSIIHGIVEEHGGRLHVRSTPGEGTVFRVHLPYGREAIAAAGDREEAAGTPEVAAPPGREWTILFADDEAPIRRLVERLLGQAGYRVLTAADTDEALATIAGDQVDLVLSDIRMPGGGGRKIAETLASRIQAPPLVFLTGDLIREDTKSLLAGFSGPVLHKPVEPDKLLATVREALAGAGSRRS